LAEIQDILTRLEAIFNATKLKYVIVGGLAIIHYGHLRTTQDIDILIDNDPDRIVQLLELLRSHDFDVMEDQFKLAYQEGTNASIFDNRSFMRLDLKVVNEKRELDVLNNAKTKEVFGLKIKMAPLEYVLLGKLQYIGNLEEINDFELLEYQDVIDFLTLFYANKERIDFSLLEKKISEYGLIEQYIRLKTLNINEKGDS
jgi:hypothetical protein